ncbi:hypothetical protein [Corynebacterium sp.]|uniref:hypothetical protein n=1 Tax=Corynebacterium sp. TaxID=1720 RepID=UPI0026DEC64A|nr:hypothetical protein [Corynebacterium sp.]MDO5512146.1 hypothetical protein [Corynebacterium sp.]
MVINAVVEGASDLGVAHALIIASGHEVGAGYAKRGKSRLDPDIAKYARAARYEHGRAWLVLRDSDGACPVQLRRSLLSSFSEPAPESFLLRIVHTMSEGWFLGDPDGVAAYFRVPRAKLPVAPEDVEDPKRFLLQLSLQHSPRAFQKQFVREDVSPGPEFTTLINDFARHHWDIVGAAKKVPSLQRALDRLQLLH